MNIYINLFLQNFYTEGTSLKTALKQAAYGDGSYTLIGQRNSKSPQKNILLLSGVTYK